MNCGSVRLRPQNRTLLLLSVLLISTLSVAGVLARNRQSTEPNSPQQRRTGSVYGHRELPQDDNPRYFPSGTFTAEAGGYDFTERWCAWYFRIMKEPSLLDEAKQQNVKVYRFLKLPPYFHPWSVRIAILPDGTGQAVVKSTSGTGGVFPGSLTNVQSIEVPKPRVDRLLHLVDESAFWSMPTIEPLPPALPGKRRAIVKVMGGTPWVLEGTNAGRYHAVERVEPPESPFATLCAFMLEEIGKVDSTPHLIQPPSVPAEVTSILPTGYKVRILARTGLTRLGETLIVYERDEATNPDPHVLFLRSGRVLKDFTNLAEGCYTEGFKEFVVHGRRRAAATAFRCTTDGSFSRFVVFAAKGDSYEMIFRQEALLGALGMWGGPGRLHLFAARTDLDPGESCLYCLHRYTISDFVWKHDHFKRIPGQTPQPPYDPHRLVEHPFFDLDYP